MLATRSPWSPPNGRICTLPKRRIPATELIRIQIIQACLRDASIPKEFQGMMMHMSSTLGGDTWCSLSLSLIRIFDAPCPINAKISLYENPLAHGWQKGTCELIRTDNREAVWTFAVSIEQVRLHVELTSAPELTPQQQNAQSG